MYVGPHLSSSMQPLSFLAEHQLQQTMPRTLNAGTGATSTSTTVMAKNNTKQPNPYISRLSTYISVPSVQLVGGLELLESAAATTNSSTSFRHSSLLTHRHNDDFTQGDNNGGGSLNRIVPPLPQLLAWAGQVPMTTAAANAAAAAMTTKSSSSSTNNLDPVSASSIKSFEALRSIERTLRSAGGVAATARVPPFSSEPLSSDFEAMDVNGDIVFNFSSPASTGGILNNHQRRGRDVAGLLGLEDAANKEAVSKHAISTTAAESTSTSSSSATASSGGEIQHQDLVQSSDDPLTNEIQSNELMHDSEDPLAVTSSSPGSVMGGLSDDENEEDDDEEEYDSSDLDSDDDEQSVNKKKKQGKVRTEDALLVSDKQRSLVGGGASSNSSEGGHVGDALVATLTSALVPSISLASNAIATTTGLSNFKSSGVIPAAPSSSIFSFQGLFGSTSSSTSTSSTASLSIAPKALNKELQSNLVTPSLGINLGSDFKQTLDQTDAFNAGISLTSSAQPALSSSYVSFEELLGVNSGSGGGGGGMSSNIASNPSASASTNQNGNSSIGRGNAKGLGSRPESSMIATSSASFAVPGVALTLVDALDLDRHHTHTGTTGEPRGVGSLSHLRDDADRPFGHLRDFSKAASKCRFVVTCTEEQDELSHRHSSDSVNIARTNISSSLSSSSSSLDPSVGIATRIKSYHYEGGEGEYLFVNLKGSEHGVKRPQDVEPALPSIASSQTNDAAKKRKREKEQRDGPPNGSVRIQRGVLRTNCVDCLDRTNVGQANVGIYALGLQLRALGLADESAEPSSSIVETYFDLFTAHGDAIALQYGGSEANKKMTLVAYEDSVRRGGGSFGPELLSTDNLAPLPSSSSSSTNTGTTLTMSDSSLTSSSVLSGGINTDPRFVSNAAATAASSAAAAASIAAGSVAQATSGSMAKLKLSSSGPSQVLTSVKRYVSNAFTDSLKQASINLFLGVWRPKRHTAAFGGAHLWDLDSDYLLHNPNLLSELEEAAAEGVLLDKEEEVERGLAPLSSPLPQHVTSSEVNENVSRSSNGWWETPLSSFEKSTHTDDVGSVTTEGESCSSDIRNSYSWHAEDESSSSSLTSFEAVLSQPHLIPLPACTPSSSLSSVVPASLLASATQTTLPLIPENDAQSSSSSSKTPSTLINSKQSTSSAQVSSESTIVDLDTVSATAITGTTSSSSIGRAEETSKGVEKARRMFGSALRSSLHNPKHSESLFADVLRLGGDHHHRHHSEVPILNQQHVDRSVTMVDRAFNGEVVERAFGAAASLVARANNVGASIRRRAGGGLRSESLQHILGDAINASSLGVGIARGGLSEGLDAAYSATKNSPGNDTTMITPLLSPDSQIHHSAVDFISSPPPASKKMAAIDEVSDSTKTSLASSTEYPLDQSLRVDAKFLSALYTSSSNSSSKNDASSLPTYSSIAKSFIVPSISPIASDANTFSRYVALAGIISPSENRDSSSPSGAAATELIAASTRRVAAAPLLSTTKTEIDIFSRSVIFPGVGAATAALQSGIGPGDLAIALGAADAGGATVSLLQSLAESSSLTQQQKWYITHPLALNPHFAGATSDVVNLGTFADEPIGREASSKLLSTYSRNLWQREMLYRASLATERHLSHSACKGSDDSDNTGGIENLLQKGDVVSDRTDVLPSSLGLVLLTAV